MAQTGQLTAESALKFYQNIGAAPYIGDLPPDAGSWLETCDGSELAPEQLLTAAWLGIELGFQEYEAAGLIREQAAALTKKHQGKGDQVQHGAPGKRNAAHLLMQQADARLDAVLDNESAPAYTRAQAGLAYGARPLFEAIMTKGISRQQMERYKHANRVAQALAVNAMHDAAEADELSPDERLFTRLLTFLVTGNSLINNHVMVLPAPPRSYEGRPAKDGWHGLLWDTHRSQQLAIAFTKRSSVSGVTAILQNNLTDAQIDADARRILMEIHTAMLDKDHRVPLGSRLANSAAGAADFFGDLCRRKLSPKLDLPDLTKYFETSGDPIQVPVDLDPISYPAINFAPLQGDADLLDWYGEQVNGRPFTADEGRTLNRIINENYSNQTLIDQMPLEDQLILHQVRLDAAMAMADENQAAALTLLDRTERALDRIQKQAWQQNDKATMYEAAVDLLRVRVVFASIVGEDEQSTRDEALEELLNLLVDMDYDRSRIKGSEARGRIGSLISGVLYSVLAMRISSGEKLLVMPALDREIGDDDLPGWDINVWPIGEDGHIDRTKRRKLRVSEKVDRVMRQGDIGIIPLNEIRKVAPVSVIAKNLISIVKQDEKFARATTLVTKWRTSLQPVFDEALQLAAPPTA